jgi:hypothetical protein
MTPISPLLIAGLLVAVALYLLILDQLKVLIFRRFAIRLNRLGAWSTKRKLWTKLSPADQGLRRDNPRDEIGDPENQAGPRRRNAGTQTT